jgi:flavodoxin short chain
MQIRLSEYVPKRKIYYAAYGIRVGQDKVLKMEKLAVVYWSGTGCTKIMACYVAEGAMQAGAEVSVMRAGDFTKKRAEVFSKIAFGCPAMGIEQLEEMEFAPMFASVSAGLQGKKVVLFGSYGWGDGQWMKNWQSAVKVAGAHLAEDGLAVKGRPGKEEQEACKRLGRSLVRNI